MAVQNKVLVYPAAWASRLHGEQGARTWEAFFHATSVRGARQRFIRALYKGSCYAGMTPAEDHYRNWQVEVTR